jgi:cytidylate kinase
MHKKQIITIAGKPGSGKSTTSKKLAATLGYQHYSSGDFFRAIGKERGIDVLATNVVAESEQEIDLLVDQKLRDLGTQSNHLVIDSRMAWHWMPYSFRVYLELDLAVAAERIITSMDEARRHVEHIPNHPAEYAVLLENRLASETKRYMILYQVNPYDTRNYDLVIDTALHDIATVETMILAAYTSWQHES